MVNRRTRSLVSEVLVRKPLVEQRAMENASPRPTPIFFSQEKTFSTKKERQTPREHPPPTPRPRNSIKSYPPVSRLFSQPTVEGPQSISFMESHSRLSTKYYDENVDKLYFNQCFESICKLGSGSFGEVFKALNKEDQKYYAVKRSKECFRGKSDRLRKLEEVKKHELLPKHPNCVQFYKAWEEREHLYIQTELCKMSLCQYSEEHHDIPESTVWNYLVDLLLAVKHLHDHDLVHLDIKPENIFISEDGLCKLGDFGLVLDISKADMSDASEGDPKYLAPELMQGIFTKAADIFSLGITILELACDLDLPRGDSAWHQLRQNQIPDEFIKRLCPSLREIICRMMEANYRLRPSVDDILQMDSINRVCKQRVRLCKWNAFVAWLKSICHYTTLVSAWFKSCLSRLFRFRHKNADHDGADGLLTPQNTEKQFPNWDMSFSDDVFNDESSENVDVDAVCTSLFQDDVKPLDDSDEDNFLKFPFRRPLREIAMSTPSSPGRRTGKFDVTCSPNFKQSPQRSPTSVRRSPRLAARHSSVDSPTKLGMGPRNLLAEFEKEANSMH